MSLPRSWKRPLIPIWNGGHRLAWAVGERVEAAIQGRITRCSCCGQVGPMLRRERSIPPGLVAAWGLSPRLAKALVDKETLLCSRCGAKLRTRRLARIVMATFPTASRRPIDP